MVERVMTLFIQQNTFWSQHGGKGADSIYPTEHFLESTWWKGSLSNRTLSGVNMVERVMTLFIQQNTFWSQHGGKGDDSLYPTEHFLESTWWKG